MNDRDPRGDAVACARALTELRRDITYQSPLYPSVIAGVIGNVDDMLGEIESITKLLASWLALHADNVVLDSPVEDDGRVPNGVEDAIRGITDAGSSARAARDALIRAHGKVSRLKLRMDPG